MTVEYKRDDLPCTFHALLALNTMLLFFALLALLVRVNHSRTSSAMGVVNSSSTSNIFLMGKPHIYSYIRFSCGTCTTHKTTCKAKL